MLLVKIFYQTATVIQVQHEFQVKFELRKIPGRSAINRIVIKFEMPRTMYDNKMGAVRTVTTPENIACV